MINTIPYSSLSDKQKISILKWRNDNRTRKWMKNQKVISEKEHLDFIDTLFSNKKKHYWLVFDNDLEIGAINLKRIDNITVEGGVFKNPDVTKPVGRELMRSLEKEAKKLGYSSVLLEVRKENRRAINLYLKIGYNIISEDETFIRMKKDSFMATIIVAELSANHNHDIEIAKETIKAMKSSGADAVKIQTYTADTITIDCKNDYFMIDQGTLWDGKNLYELYKEAFTPWEWHDELKETAESLGMIFFSTPFDITAVDFLEQKNVPLYKIASFEITDIPLIEYAASKGKPMIISTGIADAGDIQCAVDACRKEGNNDITLLQCTSSYPAPVEMANIRMIPNLEKTFGVKAGLSDHTLGSAVAVGAVALGAHMIEKHFILDRTVGGPDSTFSMEPKDFKRMVEDIRIVERAMGTIDYSLTDKKKRNRKFSRSLFVVKDISGGDEINEKNVRSIRPGYGLHPKYLREIQGKTARRNLKKGEPLDWNMVE